MPFITVLRRIFFSKKMYKFHLIKSCLNGNFYKSYYWPAIKFEVFLLEISAKIVGNILPDVSTKKRQNGLNIAGQRMVKLKKQLFEMEH